MNRLASTLLVFCLGSASCFAQAGTSAKRPMRFADLMAMKRVSDPQVSPSGKWVLFSVTDVSLEKNSKINHLWVVPVDGSAPEHQVTFGEGELNGRFAPDGRSISLTTGDQIALAPWDEAKGAVGSAVALTHVSTGADGAIWAPDSMRLLFVSSVYPECSDQSTWTAEDTCDAEKLKAEAASQVKAQLWTGLLYRHWNAYTGFRRSHVLVVSATDGNDVRDLTPRSAVGDAETPTFSLGGPLGYAWAPDSHEIAYVTNLDKVSAASTNNDVFTLRLDEAGAKAVKVSTSPGSDDGPQYSPDGKWLAFRSQARAGYESDRFRLMVMDRKTTKIRDLLPDFDRWIDEYVWFPQSKLLLPQAEAILFTYGEQGDENVSGVNLRDGRTASFTLGDGSIGGRANHAGIPRDGDISDLQIFQGTDDLRALAVRTKVDQPAELVSIWLGAIMGPPHSNIDRVLTTLNKKILEQLNLVDMESFHFAGADGTPVQGFLIKPPNFDPAKKYPVKFLIHGGPQGAWGDAWSYRWNPELMAASGYVVVMVNPRGSTGYGQAFIDGVNGDWGGKPYQDLMLGLDAAEKQFPFLDKTRECALGASYGGFMANWILTHTDRFQCIVTHDGMFNPVSAYGTTEELWFNEWEFRRHMPDGTLDPKPAQPWRYASLPADQDPFRKFSPMLYIQNAKTPTLVIHGQRDYQLDVSEGLQLFDSLQRLGVPSEMLYFPDEGHWVLKPQNSELWNQTVSDWCDKWTHTGKYAAR